ncbi:hypothetical protein CONPUDRAFT_160559 [Coniophora puteana RWD-64-598 SS2]|uniref:Uncharacterized protein n=1 Tax=Coniophora puteana (strain RWD-64-598) TaxID=741705 RepID=R7SFR2_CONPW|nr:uncharacterized protein CONPUDRAFT_160559 [Coniophora puteana RWD-64-598 SS2]EIW73929.1 hypothetical protein CONPUDRAFT_160559 [Coniophora puteana RWD-64-598 SS2]
MDMLMRFRGGGIGHNLLQDLDRKLLALTLSVPEAEERELFDDHLSDEEEQGEEPEELTDDSHSGDGSDEDEAEMEMDTTEQADEGCFLGEDEALANEAGFDAL